MMGWTKTAAVLRHMINWQWETRPRIDGNHLRIFFAICAVIETNRNPAVVDVGPAPDETVVDDVERDAFWRMGWRSAASLRQIAHNPAQNR